MAHWEWSGLVYQRTSFDVCCICHIFYAPASQPVGIETWVHGISWVLWQTGHANESAACVWLVLFHANLNPCTLAAIRGPVSVFTGTMWAVFTKTLDQLVNLYIAFTQLSRCFRDHSFRFRGDIFVVIYFRGGFRSEHVVWGSVLSLRFRGACLLRLFREALSRAFAPSYFPFAETP